MRPPVVVALSIALGVSAHGWFQAPVAPSIGFAFTNIAREAGLDATIVFGGRERNTYLVETNGTGVAMLDYEEGRRRRTADRATEYTEHTDVEGRIRCVSPREARRPNA